MCQRNGLYVHPGNNPIIGGRITEGNKSIKFAIDTEEIKIGIISETTFDKWGDVISFSDFTRSRDAVNVNVSSVAQAGNVTAVATKNIRVHSYEVAWQRPAAGSLLEKYYLAATAYANDNGWEVANQSRQFDFIEVVK
jgi:hypothetical protein